MRKPDDLEKPAPPPRLQLARPHMAPGAQESEGLQMQAWGVGKGTGR